MSHAAARSRSVIIRTAWIIGAALLCCSAVGGAAHATISITPSAITPTEGTSFSGTVATFTDDSPQAATDYFLLIDWGDGSPADICFSSCAISGPVGTTYTVSGTHTYADEGTFTTAIFVIDNIDGDGDLQFGSATVGEADSGTYSPQPIAATEGQSFSGAVVTFTDTYSGQVATDWIGSIDWGDASGVDTCPGPNCSFNGPTGGPFELDGTHTYAEEGTYTVSFTVADDPPGTATFTDVTTATVADAALTPSGSMINTIPSWDGSNPVCFFGIPNTATYGQVITAPAGSPVLTSFSFEMNLPSTLAFQGEVYAWDGSEATGPNLFESASMTTSGSGGFELITFNTGGVPLVAGNQYVIFASTSKLFPGHSGSGCWGLQSGDIYGGGGFVFINNSNDPSQWTTTAWSDFGGWDLAFKATFETIVSAVEGNPFTGTVGSFTDANPAAPASDFTAAIDWGDASGTSAGTIVSTGGGGFDVSGSHTYADEGSFSITITVNDVGGASTTINSTANVADAALTPSGTTIAENEGASFTTSIGTFTDANPSAPLTDFDLGSSVDWGDTTSDACSSNAITTPNCVISQPGGVGTAFDVSGSHTYAEDGSYAIAISILDDGSSSTTINSTANVAEVDLGSAGVGTINLVEGATFSGTVATFTDTGSPDAASAFSATIDWGDLSATTPGTVSGSAGSYSVSGSHTYAEEGSYTITVTITEPSAVPPAMTTATSTADVADAALTPIAQIFTPTEGLSFTGVVALFNDANASAAASDFTGTINWGDGSPNTACPSADCTISPAVAQHAGRRAGLHRHLHRHQRRGAVAQFQVVATHTYLEEGSVPVAVAITDDGGSMTTINSTANVADAPLTATPRVLNLTDNSQFNGVVASFTDADPNGMLSDYTATIDWGDGSPTTPCPSPACTITGPVGGVFTITSGHVFPFPGFFSVTVVITDAGGATVTAPTQARVISRFSAAPVMSPPAMLLLAAMLGLLGLYGVRRSRAN